jgi:hypothetical protein
MICETEPARTVAVIWNKPLREPYSISLRSHGEHGPNDPLTLLLLLLLLLNTNFP